MYDLTAYVDKHPGGSDKILEHCGTDGTSAFAGQHGSEKKPAAVLVGAQLRVMG